MAQAIISGRYAIGPFREQFGHCAATADLFAQVASSGHGQVRLAVDLLSTALNELLEWVYRRVDVHDHQDLVLEVLEEDGLLRIALSLPPDRQLADELSARLDLDGPKHARQRWFHRAEAARPEDASWLGLYWLAAEFGVVRVRTEPDGRIRLELELQP